MEQKKSIGFGSRGTLLVIYQFLAFAMYCVINNIGQNLYPTLNAGKGWNGTLISAIYTVASVVAIILQFVLGKYVANSGHLKGTSIILLSLAAVFTIGMATLQSSEILWLILWGLAVFTSVVGATFVVSTMVGQWFPRRKGTVMGIATLAFPIINGIALTIFGNMLGSTKGNQLLCWLPWLIMDVVGILICVIFLKEYPEQCGAYPDNDKNMTPEQAHAMLAAQEEAKKKSVWNIKNTFRTPGFWLITIPQGILLLGSVGAMTQVMSILNVYDGFVIGGVAPTAKGTITLLIFAAIGCFGSWLLGVIDTKFGTRVAIIISSALMVLSGILCAFQILPLFFVGFGCLQIFMGASSNFTVSAGAQYWRREDFPSAFSFINPLANLICAFGPFLIAGLRAATGGFTVVWIVIGALGLLSLILTLIFRPKMIIERDKKYRREAGLPEEGLTKSAAEMMGEK
jgi:MFS family permease